MMKNLKSCDRLKLIDHESLGLDVLMRKAREFGYSYGLVHLILTDEHLVTVGSVTERHLNPRIAMHRALRKWIVISKWNSVLYSKEFKKETPTASANSKRTSGLESTSIA